VTTDEPRALPAATDAAQAGASREPSRQKQQGAGRRGRATGGRADPGELALKLLAVRARSREEIRLTLSRRGYPPEEIAAVLARLAAARYLNDLELARDWVRLRAERCGFGPARLARELRARGIADQDIRAALGELLAAQSPLALAEEAARRKLTSLQGVPPPVGRRRLGAYLARRGFTTEIILRLCQKYFPSLEESSELS
jgi:regulatory protein